AIPTAPTTTKPSAMPLVRMDDYSRRLAGARGDSSQQHNSQLLKERALWSWELVNCGVRSHPSRGLRLLGAGAAGFRVHFALGPINAAPILVLGHGHPTFDTYPDTGLRLRLLREQALEDPHGH